MRMCHFLAQNGTFVLKNFFLVQTIIITFIYLLALFIVQNLKKFLQRIQNYEDVPFLGPKWSKIMFFLENYQIHSHVPASPFHCARFEKNSSSGSRVMRMHNFGPKTVHFSKWESFQKICSCALFLSFMPIYMPKMKVRY